MDFGVKKNRFNTCLIILLSILVSSHILTCSSKKTKNTGKTTARAQCGECLSVQTQRVCTARGTMLNACMAICKGVKIECYQKCPCP